MQKGGIGIDNQNNDRGDEINLDELQRYIGGGNNSSQLVGGTRSRY